MISHQSLNCGENGNCQIPAKWVKISTPKENKLINVTIIGHMKTRQQTMGQFNSFEDILTR